MQLFWNLAVGIYAAAYAVLLLRISRNPIAAITVLLPAGLLFASWLLMDSPLYSLLVMYVLIALVFAFRFGELHEKLFTLAFAAMNVFQCLWVIGNIRSGLGAQGERLGGLLFSGNGGAVLDGLLYALGSYFALFMLGAALAVFARKLLARRTSGWKG